MLVGRRLIGSQLVLDCHPLQLHRIRLGTPRETPDHASRRTPLPFLMCHWDASGGLRPVVHVIHCQSTNQKLLPVVLTSLVGIIAGRLTIFGRRARRPSRAGPRLSCWLELGLIEGVGSIAYELP